MTTTVAITGASGLVGRALCDRLRAEGHRVRPMVRRTPETGQIHWDPARAILDPVDLADIDAVIHLAGESIVGRWTPEKKRRIHDSRVEGTRLLATAMATCPRPPGVLVSASAVGFYGHRDEPVDEDSPRGTGFLADVCEAWESAAAPAREAGIRVVHPRVSVVMSADGGALAEQLPIFHKGLGGPLGSGTQGYPWIHIDDLVSVLIFLMTSDIAGPVNAVAPEVVDQATFARTLGGVLSRPAFLPAPGFAVRMMMGEMGQALLLEGAHIQPTRLSEAGFTWAHPTLQGALTDILGD